MVKDILREIKRKWFQFIAIALITALGVGFFVGIQVTGYNMRQTGDEYARNANLMDLQFINELGIDQEMVDEVDALIDGRVAPVVGFDAFVKLSNLDDVLHFVKIDNHTTRDLTLTEGRLPMYENEVVLDNQLLVQGRAQLNEDIRIFENDQVNAGTKRVVGFVDSSLYMNLERGQTRLGSGNVAGFAYTYTSLLKEDVFTSLRIHTNKVDESRRAIEENEASLVDARFARIIAPDIVKLEDAQAELDQGRIDAKKEFDAQWKVIVRGEIELADRREEISMGIAEIASLKFEGTLSEQLSQARVHSKEVFDVLKSDLESQRDGIMMNPNFDPEMKAAALAQVEAGLMEVESGRAQVNAAYDKIELGIAQINAAEVKLSNGKSSFYAAREEMDLKFSDIQQEIDDAYLEIENTSHGSIHILNRSESIVGYDDFYQDSERIELIGKVFPLIFFGVAILVTLSTVSRMVDESRVQIGIYKALGYTWFQTSLKFVAFTFIAWLFGTSLGLVVGFYMIPHLIYQAYQIMYLTPAMIGGFVWSYAMTPLVISFLSCVGVALYKSQSVARETASLLMIPPVPKGGQRILLERFGFIWNRLSFLYKVSLRNLFRNKTRFLMTVVGIAGCCGLLLTGFALKHSIFSIVDKQFDDIINYDGVVAFQSDWDVRDDLFVDFALVHSDNARIGSDDVSVYAAENMDDLGRMIGLREPSSGEVLEPTNETVILSQKLAYANSLNIGDPFELKIDSNTYTFKVGMITENFIGHYVYVDQGFYETVVGRSVSSNIAFFQYAGESDYIASTLLEDDHVLSVNLLDNIRENYIKTMGNFDIVILVIVGAAFSLQLIVLLNLITMNMSERSKELATLKVLGFYPKELSSYIMRENILITLISLVVGVIFGTYLHRFVIVSAEINLIMFNREILMSSYILAMALTFGLSVIINLFMSKRANRVNMAEALKL